MQSLADFLGTNQPAPDAGPEKTDFPSLLTMTGKVFAEAVLNSLEFRRYVVNGLTLGDLPSAVVCRLMDHGWGKPVERVEVQNTMALAEYSAAQLEERALYLAELARDLRRRESVDEPPSDEESTASVH